MARRTPPPIEQVLGSAATVGTSRVEGEGREGRLAEMLPNEPSGNIFGLMQNAGMGWRPLTTPTLKASPYDTNSVRQ